MFVTLFITVLFWGDAKPLQLEIPTYSTECTVDMVRSHTKQLRVLDGWKVIQSKCIKVEVDKVL